MLEHTQVRDVTELLLAFNQLGESGEGRFLGQKHLVLN